MSVSDFDHPMVRVSFRYQAYGSVPISIDRAMTHVPRIGDQVVFDDLEGDRRQLTVKNVIWDLVDGEVIVSL